VTESIVEAGPALVRGPGAVDADLASAAIEYIDDHIALVADQPIPVEELWREVLLSAAGSSAETLVLVCPTWWAAARVERVCEVARSIAANVVALHRRSVLGTRLARTVVEIAPELVVVWRKADTVVIHRRGSPQAVAAVVANEVGTAVVVDAPAGVHGAGQLATALADQLHARRIAVSITDADSVRHAAAELRAGDRRDKDAEGVRPSIRPGRRGAGALTGAVLSVAILCAAVAVRPDVPPAVPMTLLVEGRVGVEIPASWTVQRITSGPGSARVQVISPTDPHTAVHITQSPIPPRQTQATVAESLRAALDQQPADVFVDFNPADRKADKSVVSYREVRPGHHIVWAVFIDDTVRIGIGCQSAPDRYHQVRYACDDAIRSAHAVF
jgi:type VII secretion-associated protein (TIGR03931 family)